MNPRELTLAQLELFVRIADAGSLSAAARQLQLTPAAASASLKRLEAAFGTRLMERSTRSMRLTTEGELLRDHALRALGVMDDAQAQLGAGRERLSGDIHVAVPSDLGRGLLALMLDRFLEQHPDIRLTVHTSDQVQDLLREHVDIAVRYGELGDSSLVARTLHVTPRVVVASPDYLARHGVPQHPGELVRHNCLALFRSGRAHLNWLFARNGSQTTVRVQGNRRAHDGALVRQWALSGLGIATKARLDVEDDLRAGHLLPLLTDWQGERFPLHAVIPAGRYLPLRVRRLMDHLVQQFSTMGDTPPA
ncbi:MAG: LysR family transcriptional regulator [Gammaproteobacteria bacterium]|jgi:DNA-binding transcriptional LysR family regulator|nr:LysR family transcriptional regulator [Gammaproteobacteria bacterium]MBU0772586.1 LysR family transcriptional regulator [Gammaproteobacteria bacterium]MBU0855186.1 LysR family transcriptional regulator [Gammaproteobacteria bacterium]MBU1847376.1 LysR family transcriptional regulator [Gammaproteobacteria bacterium]